jgi:predicted adenylyl cyclase CyaB
MAFDDKEVEIKLQITVADLRRIESRLAKVATPVGTTTQMDHYYSPQQRSYLEHKYPYEWLSVRERQSKCLLNYKHFHPEGAERHEYCDEYEIEIDNPETARKILEALGFEYLVTVKKARSEFVVDDELSIALDVVDNLGQFVEIEAIDDAGGGISGARMAVRKYAEEQLGLDLHSADPRGYPYQLLKKAGIV